MPKGRPKKKVVVEESVETMAPNPVPLEENPLFKRQQELLALIQAMKNEGADDVGKLEVILSRVNQQIAEL